MKFNFNIETDKVVGVLERKTHISHVSIVIAGVLCDGRYLQLSKNQIKEIFPERGKLFVPSFSFDNHTAFRDGDLISCFAEKLANTAGRDLFSMRGCAEKYKDYVKNADLQKFGIPCLGTLSLDFGKEYIDIENLFQEMDLAQKSYISDGNYIIGPFRAQSYPAHHIVHRWKKADVTDLLCNCNQYSYIIKDLPLEKADAVDCMNHNQLFEWFRKNLKSKNPQIVNEFDNSTSWRKDFPALFEVHDEKITSVEVARFEKVENIIDNVRLYYEDLEHMINKSSKLQQVVRNVAIEQKDRLIQKYKLDLEKDKKELELENSTFKQELEAEKEKLEVAKEELEVAKEELGKKMSKLDKIEDEKHAEIRELSQEVDNINSTLLKVGKNKERLLEDFSVIKEVLSLSTSPIKNITNSFVIEEVKCDPTKAVFDCKGHFIANLKYELNKLAVNYNVAKKIIKTVFINKATFVKDVRMALAFIKATGNAKYIIQNVTPNWMQFENLWNNGLGEIWTLAQSNPETLHFFVLQDINMSSSECYARPLLDIVNGIRTKVPFGNSFFPKNLKLFATVAPVSEPEVGLPLQVEMFEKWGSIGFTEDTSKSNYSGEQKEGFLNNFDIFTYDSDEVDYFVGEQRYIIKKLFENL